LSYRVFQLLDGDARVPEVLQDQGNLQTSKAEVWSLFVILTCALNLGGFREKPFHTIQQRLTALAEAA
jgi:hypothetical protein